MSYKTTFTITAKPDRFLEPFQLLGKIAEGEECCIITAYEERVCAIHEGGYFTAPGSRYAIGYIIEATPIPAESTWPTGCDWSTDDWEDRGIYPPRPVQQAALIVTMPDGKAFEVIAPFTDETPQSDEAQINYQVNLETFERHIRNAYQYSHYPYVLPTIKTRWAWMPE
jgi:hypothetical protein